MTSVRVCEMAHTYGGPFAADRLMAESARRGPEWHVSLVRTDGSSGGRGRYVVSEGVWAQTNTPPDIDFHQGHHAGEGHSEFEFHHSYALIVHLDDCWTDAEAAAPDAFFEITQLSPGVTGAMRTIRTRATPLTYSVPFLIDPSNNVHTNLAVLGVIVTNDPLAAPATLRRSPVAW